MAEEPIDKLSELYTFDETTGTIDAADYDVVEDIVDKGIRASLQIDNSVHTSTPLGRMMEWLSKHFTDELGLNVQNANQLLISAAAGQQLDAMAQWFQLERRGATKTRVLAQVSGTAGETITQYSRARTEEGDLFEAESDIVLDDSGNGEGWFSALQTGPIYCAQRSLIHIDTANPNWETITNKTSGDLGRDIETDDSLRSRIYADRTTAIGFLGAIKNAIESIDGVNSSMVLENNTDGQLDVCGVPMARHSIFACVDCSTAETVLQEVAKAIFDNKPCGTGYTKFEDVEQKEGYAVLQKDKQKIVQIEDAYGNPHVVYFYSPENIAINVYVSVIRRHYVGANLQKDVSDAVSNWFNANKPGIGETIYASEILKHIEAQVQGIIVAECKVSDGGIDKGVSFVDIAGCQRAVAGDVTFSDVTR